MRFETFFSNYLSWSDVFKAHYSLLLRFGLRKNIFHVADFLNRSKCFKFCCRFSYHLCHSTENENNKSWEHFLTRQHWADKRFRQLIIKVLLWVLWHDDFKLSFWDKHLFCFFCCFSLWGRCYQLTVNSVSAC